MKHFIQSQKTSSVVGNVRAYYSGVKTSVASALAFQEVKECKIFNVLCQIKSRAVGADGLHKDFLIYCCLFIIKYCCDTR